MNIIRRTGHIENGAGLIGVSSDELQVGRMLSLPTKKTIPVSEIENYAIYIYGKDGIGKTSFTAQFENSFHFFYEPSGDALSLYTVEPKDWDEFLLYITLLEKQKEIGELKFKTAVIDVVDICFKHCIAHVCKPLGVDWPPSDYGKTWNKASDEFRMAVYRLKRIMGLIFVSHSTEKNIERLDGMKYDTIVPTITNTGHQVLSKFCGLKACYLMNTRGQRVLVIEPNNTCEAKNRIVGKFLYTNGNRITEISMGKNEVEAMINFKKAYNNQLVEPVVDTESVQSKPGKIIRRSK
jgi:hypothetical protein